MPESPDSRDQENAQRRWSDELERDRLAATIMEPGLPYPGPGAVAGGMGLSGDMLDDGSAKGKAAAVAADAAIAYASGPGGWLKFAMQHKEVVAIVVGFALLIQIMYIGPLVLMMICVSDGDCLSTITIGALKAYFGSILQKFFGR